MCGAMFKCAKFLLKEAFVVVCGKLYRGSESSLAVFPAHLQPGLADYCLLMFQSAVCRGMWSDLTWTSPGVRRRRSVCALPCPWHKAITQTQSYTPADPSRGLQLRASHRREMRKTLHQGDGINLITNCLLLGKHLTLPLPVLTYWDA